MKKEKAVIFDLDGTLLDSIKDIAICANQVLEEFNFPAHEIDDYKKFVGSGASVLMENCAPKNTSEDILKNLLNRFKEVYEEVLQLNTLPYDGIYEMIKTLHEQNIKIGVLSNKPHEFTVKYVDRFFKEFTLQEVHGQKDHVPKKPNPIAAIDIAKAFDIPCEDIFFVGDTDIDMKTAKGAGMVAVGVAWGFREVEELLENKADHILDTPLDIMKLLV